MQATQPVCQIDDLIPNTGVAALVDGQQLALFRIVDRDGERFYAISNYDPFSRANVISRGIVGSLESRIVVASPVYKQHFDLATGQCLEDEEVALDCWTVCCKGNQLFIDPSPVEVAA